MRNNRMEVLPSPQELLREPMRREEIARLVQQQVAEVMAERDALVFEPFFRSRQVAYELKRLQSVPEQEKFSISYERYGCMICESHATPHAGNGLCQSCRAKWFRRLTQIIKEGIKGEPALRARGSARAERLLQENAPQDGIHHTWYQRSDEIDTALYARVAKQLGVEPTSVRAVAIGSKRSNAISAALKEERNRQRLLSAGNK
jgi:hypothetical protein